MTKTQLLRLTAIGLVVTTQGLAACSLAERGDYSPEPAYDGPAKHKNAPAPTSDPSDAPLTYKHTSFLNDKKKLVNGLKPADFTGVKTTGAGAGSVKEWDSPVKNQGSRGWCTAFAQVGAVENLVNHQYGEVLDLSEIDHWYHYEEYDIDASANAAKAKYITPETSWPYNGSPISGYESTAVAKMTTYRNLPKRDDVLAAINGGHPVVIGLDVNDSWESIGSDGRVTPGGSTLGGHAVLVVAYKDDAAYGGGGYFTIKNSWGSKWGDRGYLYLPYNYCTWDDCYFLEMQTSDYKGHSPKPPAPGPTPDAGPPAPPAPGDAGPAPPPPGGDAGPPAPPPPDDDGGAPDPGPTPSTDTGPIPPSDSGPAPTPGPDGPMARDFQCTAEYDPASPGRFKVRLNASAHPEYLNEISEVMYDVDESFGAYQYWSVDNPKNGFEVPFWYKTYAHHWSTNGAVIWLKSGKMLYISGATIDW